MRKFVLPALIVVFTFSLFAQQEKHEVSVINIEVPVRVFDGDNFVDSLTLLFGFLDFDPFPHVDKNEVR
jgi:hypothetical protein